MDAKEVLKSKCKQLDLSQPFWGNQQVSAAQAIGAMLEYHLAKSAEEAEERYQKAIYALKCDSSGIMLRLTPLLEEALRIASGKK
jgi:hypothetical protein